MGKVNSLFQDAQEAREDAQMHFPNYLIEDVPHADYDNYDTLNKLFHALSPHGWSVSAWTFNKKGELPSLYKKENHSNTCRIFVDYSNTAMRKRPDSPVLSYQCIDAEGMLTFQESFDNVDKLIMFLTEEVN